MAIGVFCFWCFFLLLSTKVRFASHQWDFKRTARCRGGGGGGCAASPVCPPQGGQLDPGRAPRELLDCGRVRLFLPPGLSPGGGQGQAGGGQNSLGNHGDKPTFQPLCQPGSEGHPTGTWPPSVLTGGPDGHRLHFQNLRRTLFCC